MTPGDAAVVLSHDQPTGAQLAARIAVLAGQLRELSEELARIS